jgi:hypothetical protein
MKVVVSIYNNKGLVAKKTCKSIKEEERFIKENVPPMKMSTMIKEGWHIFRSN